MLLGVSKSVQYLLSVTTTDIDIEISLVPKPELALAILAVLAFSNG